MTPATGMKAFAARISPRRDAACASVVAAFVWALWVGFAQADGTERGWLHRVVDTAAGERTMLLYAPVVTAADPALLFVLHGNGGAGKDIAQMTRFAALADREGFVVAYPDGLNRTWNYVQGIPGYPRAHDDTAFLIAAALQVEAELDTDPERRYVVGYSNGGFMAQRLACDAPDAFDGFVAVAAGGFAGLELVCPEGVAATIAFIHGTADANVPWDGLRVERGGSAVYLTWPLPTTYAWWAQRASCALPATRSELAGNADGVEGVTVLVLEECARAERVALFGVRGGRHGWPTGAGFDASLAAWAFLRGQPSR